MKPYKFLKASFEYFEQWSLNIIHSRWNSFPSRYTTLNTYAEIAFWADVQHYTLRIFLRLFLAEYYTRGFSCRLPASSTRVYFEIFFLLLIILIYLRNILEIILVWKINFFSDEHGVRGKHKKFLLWAWKIIFLGKY